MVITFPCSICVKATGDKEDSIYCDKCNLWVHIKCNNLNYIDFKYLSGNGDPWFCLKCNSQLFPFGALSNKNVCNTYLVATWEMTMKMNLII